MFGAGSVKFGGYHTVVVRSSAVAYAEHQASSVWRPEKVLMARLGSVTGSVSRSVHPEDRQKLLRFFGLPYDVSEH